MRRHIYPLSSNEVHTFISLYAVSALLSWAKKDRKMMQKAYLYIIIVATKSV